MDCPICGCVRTKVLDSNNNNGERWRRRECRAMGHRWNTIEVEMVRLSHENTQVFIPDKHNISFVRHGRVLLTLSCGRKDRKVSPDSTDEYRLSVRCQS